MSDLHGALACLPDACAVLDCAISHLDCESPPEMGCDYDHHHDSYA